MLTILDEVIKFFQAMSGNGG